MPPIIPSFLTIIFNDFHIDWFLGIFPVCIRLRTISKGQSTGGSHLNLSEKLIAKLLKYQQEMLNRWLLLQHMSQQETFLQEF
uniref:Uncharacterized protein n=1 Tax=Strongyloides venezuelensis TaxID=75913 RepID=A0A0K0FUH6_STRVS